MARSALGIDPAHFGVTDPMHAWRIRRAMQDTQKRDSAFFARHPDRLHRVRKSQPFERPEWAAKTHEEFPIMLVRVVNGTLERRAIKALREACPDEEDFCRLLFERITNDLGDGGGKVSAFAHAEILETVGKEVRR